MTAEYFFELIFSSKRTDLSRAINRRAYLLTKIQVQSAGCRLVLVQQSIVPCRNEYRIQLLWCFSNSKKYYWRVQTLAIISIAHDKYISEQNTSIRNEYASASTKDSLKKDHKNRTEVEPISSDNRSLNAWIQYISSISCVPKSDYNFVFSLHSRSSESANHQAGESAY